MSPMRTLKLVVLAIVTGASLVLAPAAASAATFSVNPTQIFLAGRTTSTLLTLRNDSDEELRFQLSAFQWNQSATGEIELSATQDIVFFPALLTLKPKEERRIRVGSTVAPGAAEKTYRIFVEELPPNGGSDNANAVRVLTRMGIPIFVRPAKESATASLNGLGLRDGALHVSLNNTGTVHFVPQAIKVRGLAANGDRLFEQDLVSWYVLAGGSREFDVPVTVEHCARTASVTVDVTVGSTSLTEMLQTPGGACRGNR